MILSAISGDRRSGHRVARSAGRRRSPSRCSQAMVFSRRMPARMRSSAPSFSSRARTAAGVRPARSANRSISASTSSSVASIDSRRAISSRTSVLWTVSAAGSRCRSRNSLPVDARPSSDRRPVPSGGARTPRAGDRSPARPARRARPSARPASVCSRSCRTWCSASCSAPCCRSSRTRSRSASSVSSVAHFLREVVVERQQFLAADAFDRRRRSRRSRRPAPATS